MPRRIRTDQRSLRFTNLLAALERADKAFSDALDAQGKHMKSGRKDKRLEERQLAAEKRTSNEADRAWMEFCRYRPKSPEELTQYLATILRHPRVREYHRDFQLTDTTHSALVLKNANAAVVDLLFLGP